MSKDCLVELGLDERIKLFGKCKILRKSDGSGPIVYLFDEDHDNLEIKQKNAENALKLLDNGNVKLIGVESKLGGRNWNENEEAYDEERYDESLRMSKSKEFEEFIIAKHPDKIFGVESIGMFNKIGELIAKGKLDSKKMDDHPINKLRSQHFITTLFEWRRKLNKGGNMILNCGITHNDHIADMIAREEIDNIVGGTATYVRINAITNE